MSDKLIHSLQFPGLEDTYIIPELGKNLLCNWYFVGGGSQRGTYQFPINSRGLVTYENSDFSIDCWVKSRDSTLGTVNILSDGVQIVSRTAGSSERIIQNLDPNLLYGKTLTLSMLLADGTFFSGSGTMPSSLPGSNTYVIALSNYVLYLYLAASGVFYVALAAPVSTSMTVVAVKLELGSQQTLAHKENNVWVLNELPNYTEELIKCQTNTNNASDRYANKVISINIANENLLRNWYFVGGGSQSTEKAFPINQNGLTTYSGKVFAIDGWSGVTNTGSLNISSSGVTITGVSTFCSFNQYLQPDLLDGKVVTLSVLTSQGLEYGSVIVQPSDSYNLILGQNNNAVAILNRTSTDLSVAIRAAAGVSVTFYAVKLELGTQQTLVHKENGIWVLNELPNYNDELVKCKTSLFGSSQLVNQSLSTEQQVAPIETGINAVRNYAVGDLFCWKGLLYKAITSITSGTAITPDGNCQLTTCGEEISLRGRTMTKNVAAGGSLTISIHGTNYAPNYSFIVVCTGNSSAVMAAYLCVGFGVRSGYNISTPLFSVGGGSISLTRGDDSNWYLRNSSTSYATTVSVTMLQEYGGYISIS